MNGDNSALAGLMKRLVEHPTTRFFMSMHRRFRDSHLKDLVVADMDDQRRFTVLGKRVYNFGSDSFLGLDRDPRSRDAIIRGIKRWGTHNGASRAFYSVEANRLAEEKLAKWLDVEDTLIFPTVTLANMGLLPGLANKDDLLAVDRLAHSSVHEGAKIAHGNGANLEIFDPCTPEVLEAVLSKYSRPSTIVAVNGVYSMLGSTPPLRELDLVARAHGGVMYIDDAHGTGIFGDHGRGTASRELGNLRNVIMVGSLSKAFSCLGAFVTCTHELKTILKMASSTYIFGGPVAPAYLEGICTVCDILMSDEYDRIAENLRQRIRRLVDGLRNLDLVVLGNDSAIVSVLVKDRAAPCTPANGSSTGASTSNP